MPEATASQDAAGAGRTENKGQVTVLCFRGGTVDLNICIGLWTGLLPMPRHHFYIIENILYHVDSFNVFSPLFFYPPTFY